MKRFLVITTAVFAFLCLQPHTDIGAQTRMHYSIVSADSGHVALGLAVRKLNVSGTFMQSAAHPDDEHNALFALFTLGRGLRSVDVQTNRGEGGQNEIGPELFRDIGVLRTSELLAAHRIDGAEQYFTRAIDYGYSFDPQEVIRKWGQRETIGDFVRLIRTLRPDVMLTMNIQGRGGDRAHEATTILATEAYREAGDPTKYPEQLAEGLRPWQPKKLYYTAGFGRGNAEAADKRWTVVDTAAYDPLLGRTYAQIGADAHSNHKCQGTGGLPAIPGISSGRGGRGGRYELIESTIPGQMQKDEASMFDGIDTTLVGIARFAGATPPQALTAGLSAIAQQAERAQQAFAAGNDAGTAQPIEAGLAAVRTLRSQLGTLGLDEAARYEVDYRLKLEERDFEDAVLAAHGVTFEAIADDGLIIDGQPVKLSLVAINRGGTDVQVTGVDVDGFAATPSCAPGAAATAGVYTCTADARVAQDAPLTAPYFTDDYWSHPSNPARNDFAAGVPFGVAFAPSPFHATFHVKAGAADVTRDLPIQYRYVKDIYKGDKRMELAVVPALSVRMTPELAIVPAARGSKSTAREIHVTVTNGTKGPANATVALDLPAGWKASPASAPIAFTGEDESLSARFTVTPPSKVAPGEYPVGAVVTSSATGATRFTSGYQAIEYPHVERRQVIDAARTGVKVVDVRTVPGLNVGYIVGVGDQVPPAIEQLGAKVTFIDTDDLAWGDLSKYDVIVTGVRAYERRADLRAYNRRLLDYAANGGTVIVQYCKMEFNDAQYGPYPAKVSRDRVSDETVPVKVLVPDHPVFNTPNEIEQATWDGWVQERGLYFLGEKDPKYVDLVSMVDSFPDNPGVKLGSLVEGKTGKGRWLYVGLALWRQLPAGTDGAYQLLANLLALGAHGGHGSATGR